MYSKSKLNWLKSRIFCQVVCCSIGLTILQIIGNKIKYSKYYMTESLSNPVANPSIIHKD
ncbi:MAG: hypothetical protein ACFBSE_00450 [Prochloraceae cyanobacterium]